LSSKPPLAQGLLLDPPLKKANDLLKLALPLIHVILKSLSRIIVPTGINIDVEDVIPWTNPWGASEKELMPDVVDKVLIDNIASICFAFVWALKWGLVPVSLTLVFVPTLVCASGVTVIACVIVVAGDVCKLATEKPWFSLGHVLVNFILSNNLQNAIT
jgi:hypothetical protein